MVAIGKRKKYALEIRFTSSRQWRGECCVRQVAGRLQAATAGTWQRRQALRADACKAPSARRQAVRLSNVR